MVLEGRSSLELQTYVQGVLQNSSMTELAIPIKSLSYIDGVCEIFWCELSLRGCQQVANNSALEKKGSVRKREGVPPA